MTHVVCVAHAALSCCAKTSGLSTRHLRLSVMDVIVRAMRHAFQIGEVVIAWVAVYVVNVESVRYWTVCCFPYEAMHIVLSAINNYSLISIRWERHASILLSYCAGKTRLMVQFPTGSAIQLSIEA